MDRFKRIAHRGWLRRAITVATFGYFPTHDIVGKMCAAITMSIPGASFVLVIPGASFAMTTPSAATTLTTPAASVAIAIPGATIELEDCT